MSNLIEDYNNSSTKEDDLGFLTGDTRLIVLAGTWVHSDLYQADSTLAKPSSETTASALTYLFYFLAAHPDKQMLLRNELRPLIQQGHELNIKSLQQAPFLNGFINETLRLWPPVLSGLQYCTPPEGINIGTTFIPGNVTVFSPAYTVHRCNLSYWMFNGRLSLMMFSGKLFYQTWWVYSRTLVLEARTYHQ